MKIIQNFDQIMQLDIIKQSDANDLFFYIDLDGTLLDTDKIHFDGYVYAFEQFNIVFNYDNYLSIIEKNKMDKYLDQYYPLIKQEIKQLKNKYVAEIDKINFIPDADKFIDFIFINNINHVVVTNTSINIVNSFKEKLPILNKLKNWIVRENYIKPKPYPECYLLAKQQFYNREKNIFGIENSIHGYLALKNVVNNIFIVCNENNTEYKYFINI